MPWDEDPPKKDQPVSPFEDRVREFKSRMEDIIRKNASDYALTFTDNASIPIDISDTFGRDQDFWTQQLASYGLGYTVLLGVIFASHRVT